MGLALEALAAGRRAAESFLVEDLTDAEIDAFGKKDLEDHLTKEMLAKTGNKPQLRDNLRRCREAVKKVRAEADAKRAAASRAASGGGGAAGTSGGGGGGDDDDDDDDDDDAEGDDRRTDRSERDRSFGETTEAFGCGFGFASPIARASRVESRVVRV